MESRHRSPSPQSSPGKKARNHKPPPPLTNIGNDTMQEKGSATHDLGTFRASKEAHARCPSLCCGLPELFFAHMCHGRPRTTSWICDAFAVPLVGGHQWNGAFFLSSFFYVLADGTSSRSLLLLDAALDLTARARATWMHGSDPWRITPNTMISTGRAPLNCAANENITAGYHIRIEHDSFFFSLQSAKFAVDPVGYYDFKN